MSQKAIILAAGKGSRMGALCKDIPKPMLKVGGIPILGHIIMQLRKCGINHIGINTHYQSHAIEYYIQNNNENIDSSEIELIYEENLSGTAGALRSFKDFLSDQDQFIVIAGDILTDFNFQRLIQFHKEHHADISFAYHLRKESNSYLEIDSKSSAVTHFIERPSKDVFKNSHLNKVNSSIYCLSQSILSNLPNDLTLDIPKDLFPLTMEKEKLFAIALEANRWAIDTKERLAQARNEYISKE